MSLRDTRRASAVVLLVARRPRTPCGRVAAAPCRPRGRSARGRSSRAGGACRTGTCRSRASGCASAAPSTSARARPCRGRPSARSYPSTLARERSDAPRRGARRPTGSSREFVVIAAIAALCARCRGGIRSPLVPRRRGSSDRRCGRPARRVGVPRDGCRSFDSVSRDRCPRASLVQSGPSRLARHPTYGGETAALSAASRVRPSALAGLVGTAALAILWRRDDGVEDDLV